MPCLALPRASAALARCLALLFAGLCLAVPCASDAQWPEEAVANVHRPAAFFRAAWTNGERTIERLVVSQNPELPLQLAGKALLSAGKSPRWLRSTRLISRGAAQSGVEFFGGDFLPGEVAGLSLQPGSSFDA